MGNQVQTFEEYVSAKKETSTESDSAKAPETAKTEKEDPSTEKSESEDGKSMLLSKSCSESLNKVVEMMLKEMEGLDESSCESYIKESEQIFERCKTKLKEGYKGKKK